MAMKKVMVVDDSPTIQMMLSSILEEGGYEVGVASDTDQLLDRIESEGTELLFLDYQMPEVDGIDFLKKIKQNAHLKNLPVVLITGLTELDEKYQEGKRIADYAISKDLQPQQLLALVKKIFK
jgi:two-component system chemotaxis response regulator CheY